MSESPGRRRPRPSPGPAPEPKPAPAEAAEPEPAERKQTHRRPEQPAHVRRLRRLMLLGGVVAVLAATASVIVAVSGDDDGSGGPPSGTGSAAAGRGARLTHPQVATAFLAGTSSDIVAVTSYDYRRLEDALSAGLSVTTGAYRAAFRSALTGRLAATARANHVVHDFQVLDLGIGAMTPDGRQATVLVFGRQLATDRTHREPRGSLVTLCATMQHRGSQYLISDLHQDADVGAPPGSPELAAAIAAARGEVVNALTYSRARFGANLRRALSGAVDPLRGELQRNAAATRSALTKGHYDLSGAIVATAVKNASPRSVSVLVAAASRRLSATGSRVTPVRYEVTVSYAAGRWAASRIQTLAET